jgi:hypothetical protein
MKIRYWLAAVSIVLGGCRVTEPVTMPSGHYYLNPTARFSEVGKVAVLELDNRTSNLQQGQDLSQALTDELGKKHLFSIRLIHREDSAWQQNDLDAINRYTHQQLSEIRETVGADAIVYGSINRYSSYPHLLVGLHLKMVDLRDARILWALEEVWDSSDKSTQQRIQQFFATQMRSGYEPLNWKILETSPRYFNKFVVYEVSRTLPDYPSYENPSVSSENVQNFNRIPQKLANLFK